MQIEPGTHALGPENAKLSIRTGRSGGAAKAGHDLLIEVTAWSATVQAEADRSQTELTLNADATSFRVLEGKGGIKALGENDKQSIRKTIDDDVLKGTAIEFRSTVVEPDADGSRLSVRGELELFGKTRPVLFELQIETSGRVTAAATVKQSDWGIKPYSALFGALKVADEVRVEMDGSLPLS